MLKHTSTSPCGSCCSNWTWNRGLSPHGMCRGEMWLESMQFCGISMRGVAGALLLLLLLLLQISTGHRQVPTKTLTRSSTGSCQLETAPCDAEASDQSHSPWPSTCRHDRDLPFARAVRRRSRCAQDPALPGLVSSLSSPLASSPLSSPLTRHQQQVHRL